MNTRELSLLMPVYNAAEFLRGTIKSIQNQSFKNWELVIINDGSTDRSGEICDEFAQQDGRIRVIHQENQGISTTRNRLLNEVKAPYTGFVDADDYLDSDMYERLIDQVKSNNVDLAMCGIVEQKRNQQLILEEVIRTYPKQIMELDKMQDTFMSFANTLLLNSPCNKVYKSNIIQKNHISFPDLETGEDIIFNLSYLKKINRISMDEKPLYYYVHLNTESITSSYIDQMYEKGLVIHEVTESFLLEKGLLNEVNERIIMGNHVMGVFSSFFNLTHANCLLSKSEKKKVISMIIGRPYVRQCAEIHKKEKGLIGLTSYLIQINYPSLILFIMNVITKVRKIRRLFQSKLTS